MRKNFFPFSVFLKLNFCFDLLFITIYRVEKTLSSFLQNLLLNFLSLISSEDFSFCRDFSLLYHHSAKKILKERGKCGTHTFTSKTIIGKCFCGKIWKIPFRTTTRARTHGLLLKGISHVILQF